MKRISKTTGQIIRSHTLTYFNFMNLFLAGLILSTGQVKNMLFIGIVLCNSAIGIIQEWKVKKLIDSISVVTQTTVKRKENNIFVTVPAEEIQASDTIQIDSGDQLIADGTVLTSAGLEINESLLTGESIPVKKNQGDTVFSGSFAVAGSGEVQITKSGDACYANQLVEKARTKRRATSEMQDSIKRIIKYVSLAILPIGTVLYLVQRLSEGLPHAQSILGSVAGVIGMIPEGLVLLTSVSFTLGVGRLAKKRALVQEMEAIEALARVNVLCCDKTGTITTGNLEVSEVIPLGGHELSEIHSLMNVFSYAFPQTNETGEALKHFFSDTKEYHITNSLPFSSERKYSGVTLTEKGHFLLGAPEFLTKNAAILKRSNEAAAHGCRVLLLAQTTSLLALGKQSEDVLPFALVLLTDEVRSDVKDTFDFFEKAGVAMKIISGDSPSTVSYIALRAGLNGAENYIDAGELPENPDELAKIIENYTVFGRVSPEQKQKIIHAFQQNGKTTGMIGDGVNDVLSIKDADCGIAMASGSNAAKQSAHIVLIDSDFAKMKDIVDEGRTIIANVERVSALYLTKTIYSIILCTLFIILRRSYPFIPIQLSLIGATAIGIPSFFLTLEHNTKVTSKGFLRHVLRISLPCALLIVGGVTVVSILGPFFHIPKLIMSTLNLLIGGSISILVVFFVCFPMNKKRIALCLLVSILFACGFLFCPGFFGIKETFLGIL